MSAIEVPDFRELGSKLSNWGRWGADDERGTMNFIDADALRHAATMVRRGAIFDLGAQFDAKGPQPGGGRTNPIRTMLETGHGQNYPGGFHFADDFVAMPLQSSTQWDGLAHVFYDDRVYNGFPAQEAVTAHGALRCGIEKQATGMVGRGILLDIAGLRGVDMLQAGEAIQPEELDAAVEAAGVEVRSGDIMLVRTGWWKKFSEERDRKAYMSKEPGLGLRCAQWIHDHEIAAVCSDNSAIEVNPVENPSTVLPLHLVLIRDMGVTLGEMLVMEDLARDCAEDGVYEFMFAGPPIKFTNGVGSPANPVAIK